MKRHNLQWNSQWRNSFSNELLPGPPSNLSNSWKDTLPNRRQPFEYPNNAFNEKNNFSAQTSPYSNSQSYMQSPHNILNQNFSSQLSSVDKSNSTYVNNSNCYSGNESFVKTKYPMKSGERSTLENYLGYEEPSSPLHENHKTVSTPFSTNSDTYAYNNSRLTKCDTLPYDDIFSYDEKNNLPDVNKLAYQCKKSYDNNRPLTTTNNQNCKFVENDKNSSDIPFQTSTLFPAYSPQNLGDVPNTTRRSYSSDNAVASPSLVNAEHLSGDCDSKNAYYNKSLMESRKDFNPKPSSNIEQFRSPNYPSFSDSFGISDEMEISEKYVSDGKNSKNYEPDEKLESNSLLSLNETLEKVKNIFDMNKSKSEICESNDYSKAPVSGFVNTPAFQTNTDRSRNTNSSASRNIIPGIEADNFSKTEVTSKELLNKFQDVCKDDLQNFPIPFLRDDDENTKTHHKQLASKTEVSTEDDCLEYSGHFEGKKVKETNPTLTWGSQKEEEIFTTGCTAQDISSDADKFQNTNSLLEEAIDMLEAHAIVGLDYIIEYKKNIFRDGSFPFRCKLCNSAITRASIIDHVIGTKHRMRYIKLKDEAKYEEISALKVEMSEKEKLISEIVTEMGNLYGRGKVVVNQGQSEKDSLKFDKVKIKPPSLCPEDEIFDNEMSMDTVLSREESQSSTISQNVNIKKESDVKVQPQENSNSLSGTLERNFCDYLPETSVDFKKELYTKQEKSIDSPSGISSSTAENFGQNSMEVTDSAHHEDNLHSGVKRPGSPVSFSNQYEKLLKTSDDKMASSDHIDDIKTEEQDEKAPATKEKFDTNLLKILTQCAISNEEEASIAVKVINILMSLVLKFKLKHLSTEKLETAISSLQSGSPIKTEELLCLLNPNSTPSTTDSSQSITGNIHSSHDDQETVSSIPENNSTSKEKEPNQSEYHKQPETSGCETLPNPDVEKIQLTTAVSTSTGLSTSTSTSSVQNATAVSSALQPPTFLGWPPSSNMSSVQAASTRDQENQNLMWSTMYQQAAYFQPNPYANAFMGMQAYQAPYSLPRSSILPIHAAPPPPPPPPPLQPPLPPPPPSDVAYPPLPNSSSIPLPRDFSAK